MANILGISIGTRNVGLAVMRMRKLTDYRIRTFAGAWNDEKCESIWGTIEAIIKQHSITDMTVKLPPTSHQSANIRQLINGITELGKWFHIEVHTCTMQDIKELYGTSGRNAHKGLAAAIIERYPEVRTHGTKSKRSEAYNAKLYEAVACAERALRAGH